MAFFELRQYQVKAGNMDVWVEFMEKEVIPFVVSKGMTVVASFKGEENQSLYFWIRRFENETERKALYDAVYESEYWKNSLSPKVGGIRRKMRRLCISAFILV